MVFLASLVVCLPIAAAVGISDSETEAWVRHVESRVSALRGVAVDPPLEVAAFEGRVTSPGPPVGPLASPPAIVAFGLGDPVAVRSSLGGAAFEVSAAGGAGAGILVSEQSSEARRRVDVTRAVVLSLLVRHHAIVAEPSPDDDAALARRALFEGEVRWISGRVLAEEAAAVAATLETGEDVAALAALDRSAALAAAGAPSVVRRWWWLEGEAGESFVRAIHSDGGWVAVDAAYRAPPTSTEQLLHPRRAFLETRDEPRPVELAGLLPRLPAGTSLAAEGVLGEHFTGEFVRLAGDPVRAVRVAEGWDGDRYRVFSSGDEWLLQWDSVFDTEDDAKELVDALRKVLQRRYHRTVVGDGFTVTMASDLTRVVATDPDGTTRSCALRDGDRVRWIDAGPLGPDAEALLTGSDV